MEIKQFPLFSKIVDLTLAVYRVTSFFPREEPLRKEIRTKANTILAQVVRFFYTVKHSEDERLSSPVEEEFFSEIDILRGYFVIAGNQRWVKGINFEILDTAYTGIKQEFKEHLAGIAARKNYDREEPKKKAPPIIDKKNKIDYNNKLPGRQKKIFEHIANNGKTQAIDLLQVLDGTNIRTIRRDLGGLVRLGLLSREARGRQIFFRTKKPQTA